MTRTLTVNCGDDENCRCRQQKNAGVFARNRDVQPHSVRVTVNFSDGAGRDATLDGRSYRVYPVVMIQSAVVMNGSIVPEDELFPESWNGVPVTVGHPELPDGAFQSANDPSVLETWAVGTIFNARVEGGALKAEAWIDVEKAEKTHPGLVETLNSGASVDVSTGYYSKQEERSGVSNGKQYQTVARDLLPDHLALLPGDVGACSWEDGCGVRNKKENSMSTLAELLANSGKFEEAEIDRIEVKLSARGDDDDSRQMIADLISNDTSPFIPDDMYGLMELNYDTLVTLRDQFLGAPEGTANSAEDNPEEGGQNLADTKDPPEAKANASERDEERKLPQTVAELDTLIANAVQKGVESYAEKQLAKIEANAVSATGVQLLSDEDRAALDGAKRIQAEHRVGLEKRVTANSNISEDEVKAMPLATLEVVANGLRTPTDYGVRPQPNVNALEDDDPALAAMSAPSVDELIQANRKVN